MEHGETPRSVPSGWKWQELWATPDPDLIDAGQRGEWLIAGIRLLIVLLLLALPLREYLRSPGHDAEVTSLWVAVAALAEALVVYSAVRRSWGRSWIGFFSGLLDVSLITLCLWIFVRLGEPLTATRDLVLFPLYLLAIGATSLRFDWRVCVLTGAAAIAQYALLVRSVVWLSDTGAPASEAASAFGWNAQLGRLLLLAMATLLATSLVVRAREQRHLSTRDRLTSLANRGFFDESLRRLEAFASRSGDTVTIAMIDADHFKRFNDTYGHLAGDVALRRIADVLGHSFRATDLIARYGGEEFAGIFLGLDREAAAARLERIREAVADVGVPVGTTGETARVTVSIGLASWPADGDNLKEVLAIADDRLYLAKQGGRNRMVSSSRRPGTSAAASAGETAEGRYQEIPHASL